MITAFASLARQHHTRWESSRSPTWITMDYYFTRVIVTLALLRHRTSHLQNKLFHSASFENPIFGTCRAGWNFKIKVKIRSFDPFYSYIKLNIFFLVGQKVHVLAPYGANKCIFWPPSGKKNRIQHGEKHLFFLHRETV